MLDKDEISAQYYGDRAVETPLTQALLLAKYPLFAIIFFLYVVIVYITVITYYRLRLLDHHTLFNMHKRKKDLL